MSHICNRESNLQGSLPQRCLPTEGTILVLSIASSHLLIYLFLKIALHCRNPSLYRAAQSYSINPFLGPKTLPNFPPSLSSLWQLFLIGPCSCTASSPSQHTMYMILSLTCWHLLISFTIVVLSLGLCNWKYPYLLNTLYICTVYCSLGGRRYLGTGLSTRLCVQVICAGVIFTGMYSHVKTVEWAQHGDCWLLPRVKLPKIWTMILRFASIAQEDNSKTPWRELGWWQWVQQFWLVRRGRPYSDC